MFTCSYMLAPMGLSLNVHACVHTLELTATDNVLLRALLDPISAETLYGQNSLLKKTPSPLGKNFGKKSFLCG